MRVGWASDDGWVGRPVNVGHVPLRCVPSSPFCNSRVSAYVMWNGFPGLVRNIIVTPTRKQSEIGCFRTANMASFPVATFVVSDCDFRRSVCDVWLLCFGCCISDVLLWPFFSTEFVFFFSARACFSPSASWGSPDFKKTDTPGPHYYRHVSFSASIELASSARADPNRMLDKMSIECLIKCQM